jgi:hypothetical protein
MAYLDNNGLSYLWTNKIKPLIAKCLPLTGGTLTGKLKLSGAPTEDMDAATKKYVDDSVAGAGSGPKQYTGTLLASGWSEDSHGYQAQTITITGLKAAYDVDPQWDVALSGTDPDADAALLEGFALIHNYKTGANSLTAQCIGKAPTVNVPVKVVVFG